ncbi:MAG: nickel pincer cofactor biosynthesis protein LarC [Acidimicrobiales bacterium]
MTRVAWFHCFSGIAGDMALGALLDAGAALEEVRAACAGLGLEGWTLEAEPALRGGIAGVKVHVRWEERHEHRTHAAIVELIGHAALPPRVEQRALAVFDALAQVEGRLHGVPAAEVAFHEVGAVDSIVDIVGVCAALELLGVDEVRANGLVHGTGVIRTRHGILPNPPPAVVALASGAPSVSVAVDRELTTPTGAALLAALGSGWGPLPAMTIAASGFGAGSAELADRPNHVQVVVGEAAAAASGPGGAGQPAALLETNLDDATGETIAYTIAALLEAGARDAWTAPVTMKKGRPGQVVSVLADVADAARLAELLRRETGTLGVRAQLVERWPAPRRFVEVELEGHAVRVKLSDGRRKAEHDDAAAAARALGWPLREVAAQAEERARQSER